MMGIVIAAIVLIADQLSKLLIQHVSALQDVEIIRDFFYDRGTDIDLCCCGRGDVVVHRCQKAKGSDPCISRPDGRRGSRQYG